jgi:hypothetical protein
MQVTRVFFSSINDKWYLQINNLQEIQIPEREAFELIKYYELTETNMFRWELIK